MPELPGNWQQASRNFTLIPVLSDPAPADDWFGRTGLVHQAVLDDFADLYGYRIYACGRPAMIDIARKTFTATCGLPPEEFSLPTASPTRCTRGQGARHSSGDGRLDSDSRLDCLRRLR